MTNTRLYAARLALLLLVGVGLTFQFANRTASANGPLVTVAHWDAASQCVAAQHWAYGVEELVKQTLVNEWFPTDRSDALRAGASIIRQDFWYFYNHAEGLPFCLGVVPYSYHMRDSRMNFIQGTAAFSTAAATDETVTEGWNPNGGSSSGLYLSFIDTLQLDTQSQAQPRGWLQQVYGWLQIVGGSSYPPGEYASNSNASYHPQDIGLANPLTSVCVYDCALDYDGDGVTNVTDNCRLAANATQTNTDGDAMGDACDQDDDGDGCPDANEPSLVPPISPTNRWDFYSVPVPALFAAPNPTVVFKDAAVGASDAQAVFAYFQQNAHFGVPVYDQDLNLNSVVDGIEYDRSIAGPAMSGPPDGIVTAQEGQLALAQSKKNYFCLG